MKINLRVRLMEISEQLKELSGFLHNYNNELLNEIDLMFPKVFKEVRGYKKNGVITQLTPYEQEMIEEIINIIKKKGNHNE